MSHYGGGGGGGRDDRYGDNSSFRGGGGGGGGGGGKFGSGGIGDNLRSIHWDIAKLPVFEKNFYIEHPAVTARPETFADEWRKSNEITIVGKGIPKV